MSVETELRLDAIAKNLGVGNHWWGDDTETAVIDVCVEKVSALIDAGTTTGELLAGRVAKHFQVKFEEVRSENDIAYLEDTYLRKKREIGFALLRKELYTPKVDALLYQRANASQDDGDRWVAVLNMLKTEDRAYWNRYHELAHRLAEPPQQILPLFRREIYPCLDAVEVLMDNIAGRIAFHPKVFEPHLRVLQSEAPDFESIEMIRAEYAPSSSLLAVVNAVVQRIDRPCLGFTAAIGTKKDGSSVTQALRVQPQARNALARAAGLALFPNMRVPLESSVYQTFLFGGRARELEQAAKWKTSSGSSLPDIQVEISSIRLGERVYGIITI